MTDIFKNGRQTLYKNEKILRAASLKNIKALIYVPEVISSYYFIDYINDIDKETRCLKNCRPCTFMKETYTNIENLETNGICLVSEEDAEKFNDEIGVHFAPGEIERADFQKLKDDNFIIPAYN